MVKRVGILSWKRARELDERSFINEKRFHEGKNSNDQNERPFINFLIAVGI
jgi:hypothetical protein